MRELALEAVCLVPYYFGTKQHPLSPCTSDQDTEIILSTVGITGHSKFVRFRVSATQWRGAQRDFNGFNPIIDLVGSDKLLGPKLYAMARWYVHTQKNGWAMAWNVAGQKYSVEWEVSDRQRTGVPIAYDPKTLCVARL
jgi:hypothetical protein